MNKPVMNNEARVPTEGIIFQHIGAARAQWDALFAFIQEEHPDFESEWRFYKDGNAWLMKTTRKKKTIFWLSVVADGFIVAFYFGDKAEPAILESDLSKARKDDFVNGKRYGKVRGISITMTSDDDLADVKALIPIRIRF